MSTAVNPAATTTNPFAALAASGAASGAAEAGGSGGASQDRFMTLLVAQMKNQDPLNPMDNAQVTSQIAQIDTVKGIAQLNETVQKLLGNADAAQSMQAAALIGHTALVDGRSIELTGTGGAGGFNLTTPAEDVTVHRASLGAMTAGIHSFAWDGKTDAGAAAVPGAYTFSVNAMSGGKNAAAESLAALRIDGVTPSSNGTTLQLRGAAPVQMNQIRQLF